MIMITPANPRLKKIMTNPRPPKIQTTTVTMSKQAQKRPKMAMVD